MLALEDFEGLGLCSPWHQSACVELSPLCSGGPDPGQGSSHTQVGSASYTMGPTPSSAHLKGSKGQKGGLGKVPSTPWTQTLACPPGEQAWVDGLAVITAVLWQNDQGKADGGGRRDLRWPPSPASPGFRGSLGGDFGLPTVPRGRCALMSPGANRKSPGPRGAQWRVGRCPGSQALGSLYHTLCLGPPGEAPPAHPRAYPEQRRQSLGRGWGSPGGVPWTGVSSPPVCWPRPGGPAGRASRVQPRRGCPGARAVGEARGRARCGGRGPSL